MTDYTKLRGYETVRYPKSGLVGLPGTEQANITKEWNDKWSDAEAAKRLNQNVKEWLRVKVENGKVVPLPDYPVGTFQKFQKCLKVDEYVLFSNTSSARQYNQEQLNNESTSFRDVDALIMPLEAPHNDMHLCIGGYTFPGNHPPGEPLKPRPGTGNPGMPNKGELYMSNGDMVSIT